MSSKYLSNTSSPNEAIDLRVNDLTVDGTFTHAGDVSTFSDITVTGAILRTSANVTQATSLSTAVTCNGPTGTITCFDPIGAPIAPGTITQFTVNNSSVQLGDLVFITTQGQFDIVAGFMAVQVHQVEAGSFKIQLCSVGSAAFTGQLVIAFQIIRPIP